MGMTNRQFQGFLRLALSLIEDAAKISPDNEKLQELLSIFKAMLEDGTD